MTTAILLVSTLLAAEPPAKSDDLGAYQAAAAAVGRDAQAHVKLALWCEAHGLQAERVKHLALAVLADPKNATARGLMGLVAFGGQWKRPDAVAQKVKDDEALTAALAEYNARRDKAPDKADAQWELALWCEQHGLDAEARAHFTAVTRLDPSREAAWKRLGCKKVNGRWASEAQIAAEKAEAEAQKKADKYWKPLLTKWRGQLTDKNKKETAEKALSEVNDPFAASSVWSVLVVGKPANHALAVQLFGQIDSPASSRALAFLAVFDGSAEVRRAATETLKGRDPREFAAMLIALLRDPIKYEVKPVGGPGSPGALFVEGKQFNVQRMYAPPPMPNVSFSPNAQLSYDSNGLPVIVETSSVRTQTINATNPVMARMSLADFERFNPTDPALASAVAQYRSNAPALWQQFFQKAPNNNALMRRNPALEKQFLGVTVGQKETGVLTTARQTTIPVGRMVVEYQNAAIAAQQQLAQDVATVDDYNDRIRDDNERVAQVLGAVSGQDRGQDRTSWLPWWVDLQGYAYTPPPETSRPTLVENVPLAYVPQAGPVTRNVSSFSGTNKTVVEPYSSMPSCFGAGTLVRTLDGSRPIETIKAGDRVLTQSTETGALGYQPVTAVHHNPPSPTFLVKVGNDTIVSSPFHRFWLAGKGWKMARDLKAGDNLRLLDGPAQVNLVESGPVQPVFNLDVAGDHDFFVGTAAALVHDNTLPDTRLNPFDAAPELAAVKQ